VSLPAIAAGAGLVALFLAVKVGAKVVGVWPTARAFGLPTRDANYTTLLMSTGLTFGTIAALYGLTNGYIDQPTYTILVTVVILSAVVPTLIATTFFEPEPAARRPSRTSRRRRRSTLGRYDCRHGRQQRSVRNPSWRTTTGRRSGGGRRSVGRRYVGRRPLYARGR